MPPRDQPRQVTAAAVHRRMKALHEPSRAALLQRYFKTGAGEYGAGDRFLGIRLPVLRGLSREYSDMTLGAVSALLKSPWHEERLLALLILVRQYNRADASRRQAIFRLYLRNTRRINNWDLVDCSAAHIVGAHVGNRGLRTLTRLARSRSVWERRIAVIATFPQISRGRPDSALAIARVLLDDRHDLIHKAVGWMLREIGKRDRPCEEVFLKRWGGRMPRTMLRYAIERFPPTLRRRYLAVSRSRPVT